MAGVRKALAAEMSADGDSHQLTFSISTDDVDRERDILSVDGWNTTDFIKTGGPVLWAHDYSAPPIGRTIKIWTEDHALKATAEFTSADLNPFGDMIYRMYLGKFIKSVSVGFQPDEYSYDEQRRGVNYKRQSLLEFSAVPVPANPSALLEAKAAGIDVEPLREWAAKTLERLGGASVRIGPGEILLPYLQTSSSTLPGTVTYSFNSAPTRPASSLKMPNVVIAAEPMADECPMGDDCPMKGKAAHDDCPKGDDCPMKGKAIAAVGKPFPNEHACRLRDPGDFQDGSFRRTEREHDGKTYAVIMGRLKGEETMTEQAFRYPKGTWTAEAARGHCGSHDGSFEAASGEGTASTDVVAKRTEERPAARAAEIPEALVTVERDDDLVTIELDDDTGITAEDLLAALREGIGAQAEASVRRALTKALGRVD